MADVVRRWIRIGALAGVVGATGILLIFLWIGADPKVELTVTAVERRMFLLAVWSAVVGRRRGSRRWDRPGHPRDTRIGWGLAGRVQLRPPGATYGCSVWPLSPHCLWSLSYCAGRFEYDPAWRCYPPRWCFALVVIEALGSHAASVESALVRPRCWPRPCTFSRAAYGWAWSWHWR